MQQDDNQNKLYTSLQNLKTSVDSLVYLSDITPCNDDDYAIKSILVNNLRNNFESVYVEVADLLHTDSAPEIPAK